MSELEDQLSKRLWEFIDEYDMCEFLYQYRPFIPANNMSFDFCWPIYKIGIELQGGIDSPGRRSGHTSRDGMRRDMFKVNLAQATGWILFQWPPDVIRIDHMWYDYAIRFLLMAFEQRGVKLVSRTNLLRTARTIRLPKVRNSETGEHSVHPVDETTDRHATREDSQRKP